MSRYTEVKSYVEKLQSNQYQAWRNDPANRDDVALLDGGGSQAPGPAERYAVLRPCLNCRADVPTASDYQEQVFCSDKCKKSIEDSTLAIRKVFADFKSAEPNFYDCAFNTELLINTWKEVAAAKPRFNWTVSNAKLVFESLTAEGKLLPPVSVKQLNAMTSDQYSERLRLDPNLGGHKAEIDKKEVLATPLQRNEHPELPKPTTEMDFQEARNAVNRNARIASANYTNRYQTTRYVNGLPVEPEKSNVAAAYRNGRRVI
jgi:hypothetical protein